MFPAKELRESLELNIQLGLRALLHALDVPRAAIDHEIGEMQFFMYGNASNRRVLGSMNEFAFMLGYYMQHTNDPLALALRLADTPMRALGGAGRWKDFGVPNDVAVELLTGRQSGSLVAN
jgi:hypothetical protein